jgi:hypothetical protein
MALCMAYTFIEKKLWFATVAMAAAFFYACLHPHHVWWAMSVANVMLLLNFLVAWRDPGDREYRNQVIRTRIEAIQRRFR